MNYPDDFINHVIHGDCLETLAKMPNHCVDLVLTSPPYADQRKQYYNSISEKDYPFWTVRWMQEVRRVLKPKGSVLIIIRPHIKNGQISDYVLRTRLAVRGDGWKECEELIWVKPDSPPLGSVERPRRAWESILWFSPSPSPYCDTKANGTKSDRIGFESKRFAEGGESHIHAGQNTARAGGVSRSRDYVEVGVCKVDRSKYNDHPAQFPQELSTWLVRMFAPTNGVVLDLFSGSGTVAVSCLETGRCFIAMDKDQHYCEIANHRIQEWRKKYE